jgi:hypothetical protein
MANIITAGNSTNGGTQITTDTSGTLNIVTGSGSGATAVTVDGSQNVGVGTTTPNYRLDVLGAANAVTLNCRGRASDNYSLISFSNNAGTIGSYIGSSDSTSLSFYTNTFTERMRLDANGRLYINTSAAVGALPAYQTIVGNANSISIITLQDTGTTYGSGTQYITFANSSATVAGSIQHNAAGTVNFATSSDFRLKENIVDSSNALTVVDAIKVRAFDWKEDNGHVDFGFIAQELQQHYPDAVCVGDNNAELTDPKGTWQVDYGKLTPLLLKAIQELKAELDALKAKVGE